MINVKNAQLIKKKILNGRQLELLLLNLWISDLIFEHLTIKMLTRNIYFKIMLQLLRMQIITDNFNYIIV